MSTLVTFFRSRGHQVRFFLNGKIKVEVYLESIIVIDKKSGSAYMTLSMSNSYRNTNMLLADLKSGIQLRKYSDGTNSAIYVEYGDYGYHPLLVVGAFLPFRVRFYMTGDPPKGMEMFRSPDTLEQKAAFLARKSLYKIEHPKQLPITQVQAELFTLNRIIRETFFKSESDVVNELMLTLRMQGVPFSPASLNFDYVASNFDAIEQDFHWILTSRQRYKLWKMERVGDEIRLTDSEYNEYTVKKLPSLDVIAIIPKKNWSLAAKQLTFILGTGSTGDVVALYLLPGDPAIIPANPANVSLFFEGIHKRVVSTAVYLWMMKVMVKSHEEGIEKRARAAMRIFFDRVVEISGFDATIEQNPFFRTLLGETSNTS